LLQLEHQDNQYLLSLERFCLQLEHHPSLVEHLLHPSLGQLSLQVSQRLLRPRLAMLSKLPLLLVFAISILLLPGQGAPVEVLALTL